MLIKGSVGFLAHMASKEGTSLSIEKALIVREFQDVFSKELSRLLPENEAEFSIELTSDTTLTFKAPCKMALPKVYE